MDSEITIEEKAPSQDLYRETSPLFKKVKEEDILRKRYPKQDEIDKMLTPIRKKALRDYHLPLKARELQQAQVQSPYFKDIMVYLESGILSRYLKMRRRVINQAENFITIHGVPFRMMPTND